MLVGGLQGKPWLNAGLALVLLFMASVALHTAMYRIRPEPDRLTGFYLAMSVGGALGGVFAALIAPLVFDWTYEYPLLVLAAGHAVPSGLPDSRDRPLVEPDRSAAADHDDGGRLADGGADPPRAARPWRWHGDSGPLQGIVFAS